MTVSATQMNPCVTRSFVNPGSAARSINTNWERGYRGLSLRTSSANHWLYTSSRSGLLYEGLSEGQRGLRLRMFRSLVYPRRVVDPRFVVYQRNESHGVLGYTSCLFVCQPDAEGSDSGPNTRCHFLHKYSHVVCSLKDVTCSLWHLGTPCRCESAPLTILAHTTLDNVDRCDSGMEVW